VVKIQPLFDELDRALAEGLKRSLNRAEHIRWTVAITQVSLIKNALSKGSSLTLDGDIDWEKLLKEAEDGDPDEAPDEEGDD